MSFFCGYLVCDVIKDGEIKELKQKLYKKAKKRKTASVYYVRYGKGSEICKVSKYRFGQMKSREAVDDDIIVLMEDLDGKKYEVPLECYDLSLDKGLYPIEVEFDINKFKQYE